MVQRVADRLRGRAAAGQARELCLEPGEQRLDQRPAPRLADALADLRRLTAELGLDGIERGDAPQDLLSDRRGLALRPVPVSPRRSAPYRRPTTSAGDQAPSEPRSAGSRYPSRQR